MTRQEVKALVEQAGPCDAGEFNEVLGFHIRRAHVVVYRHFTSTFSELDLTQMQLSFLWLISDNPGLAQTDLAGRLLMDRATTMGIVNRLQARHLLRRGPSAEDRRRKALYLTPEGDALLVRAKDAIRAHERWLDSRFTRSEIKTLTGLLDRIHE